MCWKNHYNKKNKKFNIGSIRWENHERIYWIKSKIYSYLIGDDRENKKAKGTKRCVVKRKLKFEDYKNCLQTTQIKKKINHLQKSKIDVNSLK